VARSIIERTRSDLTLTTIQLRATQVLSKELEQ
jgi:hypothetical protein